MDTLKIGQRIKSAENGPPWIIVDENIQSVIVTAASWPCSLWSARVIKLGDMSGLIANPGYWRANEIELIEELPAGTLFGEQGDKIASLLDQVKTLTLSEVDELNANMAENDKAKEVWKRAWNCWNENQKYPRSHTYDDGMTLASPGNRDKEMSPANHGFLLMHDLFFQRARELEGHDAFIEVIEYGETEIELKQNWKAACEAFLQKAMGLSMAQHLSAVECATLSRVWSTVYGQEKEGIS